MTKTILIVDDSEDDQNSYRRALKDSGFAIIGAATTVADGLAKAATFRPELVLLDYNLPDAFGVDFIRRVNQNDGESPAVIMMTGSGDESVAVEAMKAGAYDYIIKDVQGGHLKLLPTVLERAMRERRHRRERLLAEGQLRLAASVYFNIAEGIVTTDAEGTIVSVNPAFCLLTGYTEDELVGGNPRILKSNRHGPEFYQAIWASISQENGWQGEIWNRRKDGSLFLARQTITAIRDERERVSHYVAVMSDVTESRKAEEFIRHQAFHDPLTNLANRSLFMDRLRQEIARCQRLKNLMAVLFIDLDRFKQINDDLGHEVGDELLKAAASRLTECVRESDTVARLGGDEFTAILNDLSSRDDATRIAQKMLDQMCKPFNIGANEVRISASIGVALSPADGDNGPALLKAADGAMYEAKRTGRSAFAFAS